MAKKKIKQPQYDDEGPPKVHGPGSEKQKLALLNQSDLLLVGGAMGGSKSYMALLKALGHCLDDPAARVVIVRESFPVLKAQGGLVDESKYIYRDFGAEWKQQPLEWHFPNGAIIKFLACPDNLEELKGSQFTLVIVDEASNISLEAVMMLKSRLRGARYKGKLQMVLTTNPDNSSWLFPWVSFSLDPDTGIPLPGTENRLRWFVMINNKMYWADSPEELYELYGKPNGLVKGTNFFPSSMSWIPMTIEDNPILMKNNPGYLANLMSMSRVNQQRFRYGSWTAVIDGSAMVTEDMFEYVDHGPVNPVGRVRGWDLAASVPNEANRHRCDWTAGVLISKDRSGTFYIEDVVRFQRQIDGVLDGIKDTALEDGLSVPQVLPADPGQAGKVALKFYTSYLAAHGITTKTDGVNPHSNKVTRFGPFASVAAHKTIKIVRGEWNKEWLDELCHFTGERNRHDDQVDATSSAFNKLARESIIPSFHIPDMSNPDFIPRVH